MLSCGEIVFPTKLLSTFYTSSLDDGRSHFTPYTAYEGAIFSIKIYEF